MIAAYFRERFRPVVFVPVAAIIAAASRVSTGIEPWTLAEDIGFALLLLLQFRLWDDLADRHTDGIRHPERVLARAPSTRRFVLLCTALAFVTTGLAALRDDTALAVSSLVALQAALGLWYALRSRRSIAGDQLLLAKYPAFVLIVAGGRAAEAPLTTAIAAAAIYAAASIYEAWHDPASPAATLLGGRS